MSEPDFGPDGTMVFFARHPQLDGHLIIVALDTAGHVKQGWPIEEPPGSRFGSLALGPDGSVYVEELRALEVGNVLHRLDATGRDLPGWPFEVPASFACPSGEPYNLDDPRTPAVADPCYPPSVDIAPNGTAYLTNRRPTSPRLIAIDPSGEVEPGWPIALDDQDWTDMQLGADGSVYLVRRPVGSQAWDPVRGAIDDRAELWAVGQDGQPRPGWPVPVPNISGFVTTPDGDVVVRSLFDDLGELCPYPLRTVYMVLGADGRVMQGWPVESTGFGSFPVVDGDGTVYYVSAKNEVFAHDGAGEVKTGWPVPVAGAGDACGPESPALAPDGTIFVRGDVVAGLTPGGQAASGWPYRPAGEPVGPCLASECYGGHAAPAFGPDGTVYLLVFHTDSGMTRAEVVGLDRQAQPKPGWPYRVPFNPASVEISLAMSPDGRLYVRGGNEILALDPDARISD